MTGKCDLLKRFDLSAYRALFMTCICPRYRRLILQEVCSRPEEDMTKITRMGGLIYANVEGSNDRCRTGEDLGASLS